MAKIEKPNTVKEDIKDVAAEEAAALAAIDTALEDQKKDDTSKGAKLTNGKKVPVNVISTENGYYRVGGVWKRIKPGFKFTLEDESDFSHNWMKKI